MDIREMKVGEELDIMVGQAIGATPKIMWFAMNKEEIAYHMDFEYRKEAEDWHNNVVKNFPTGRYAEDGGHIVRKEIYKRYSEDISAAWEVRQWLIDNIGGVTLMSVCDENPEYCEVYRGKYKNPIKVYTNSTPHSLCIAALLTKEES